VRLSGERFEAPEILFRPELVGVEQPGLSDLVFACIQQADVDLRSSLYQHIILSGGTSMMAGFAERLQADLERLYCQRINATKSVCTAHVVRYLILVLHCMRERVDEHQGHQTA
jgi:actin-related protein